MSNRLFGELKSDFASQIASWYSADIVTSETLIQDALSGGALGREIWKQTGLPPLPKLPPGIELQELQEATSAKIVSDTYQLEGLRGLERLLCEYPIAYIYKDNVITSEEGVNRVRNITELRLAELQIADYWWSEKFLKLPLQEQRELLQKMDIELQKPYCDRKTFGTITDESGIYFGGFLYNLFKWLEKDPIRRSTRPSRYLKGIIRELQRRIDAHEPITHEDIKSIPLALENSSDKGN